MLTKKINTQQTNDEYSLWITLPSQCRCSKTSVQISQNKNPVLIVGKISVSISLHIESLQISIFVNIWKRWRIIASLCYNWPIESLKQHMKQRFSTRMYNAFKRVILAQKWKKKKKNGCAPTQKYYLKFPLTYIRIIQNLDLLVRRGLLFKMLEASIYTNYLL